MRTATRARKQPRIGLKILVGAHVDERRGARRTDKAAQFSGEISRNDGMARPPLAGLMDAILWHGRLVGRSQPHDFGLKQI